MGRVYRARHVNLDKTVAIKVLHPEIGRDPQVVERFHREARAASRLEHPHSLQVLDFGKDEDLGLFISMEFLDGQDVESFIKASGALDAEHSIRIMVQVLSALGAAHDLGIVHRDMKPGNVMLLRRTIDDQVIDDFVKVCDFGLAKVANPEDRSQAELTKTGTVFGTPSYMSPEQARGDKTDARTDLYACGVILFKMLTGDVPFPSETIVGTLMRHISDPVPAFESVGARADRDLEAIVHKAMAKERDERYATARDMRADLLVVAARRGFAVEGAEPSRASSELLALKDPASEPDGPLATTIVPGQNASERTMSSLRGALQPGTRVAIPVLPAVLGLVLFGGIATFLFLRKDAVSVLATPIAIDAGFAAPQKDAEVVLEMDAPASTLPELLDAGAPALVRPEASATSKPKTKDAGAISPDATAPIPVTPPIPPDASIAQEPAKEAAPDASVPEPVSAPDAGIPVKERPIIPLTRPEKPLASDFSINLQITDLEVSGGISKRRVESALERMGQELGECLRKDLAKVGREVGGTIGVKARIDTTGRLVDIGLESKLPGAEPCLRASLASARMPKPDTGSVNIGARLLYASQNPG